MLSATSRFTTSWLAGLASALALALVVPRVAWAQTPPPTTPPPVSQSPPSGQAPPTTDEAAAKAHYEKGTAAYALGDFAEAARQYELAFRLKLDPALLYNAAQAHRRANNRPRAIELYENLLRLFPNAPNREVARQHLEELKRAEPAPAPSAAPPSAEKPKPAATEPPAPTSSAPAGLTPPPVPTFHPASAAPAVALEQQAEPPPRPIYKKAWFWGAVAGVVVVGVLATLAVSGKDKPAMATWGRVGER